MFHTTSTLGLAAGFLANTGLLYIEEHNDYFNSKTMGSIITIALSFILLIFSLFFFTEAHSNKFNITSVQMFGEGIINDEDNFNGDDELSSRVRRKTTALKDIDSQLGNFNKQNRFDDTNLVSQSVSELAMREEGQLHYLLKDFIVYLLIIFTTKFVNESIFINSFIIYVDENGNITSQSATATNTIQAGNYQPLTSDGATSLQPVDTVTSGNMHSVTSGAVYSALQNKANKSAGVYYINLTPRQLNTPETITEIVSNLYNQGYRFIVFGVGWEEYETQPHPGSAGYFLLTETSASGVGFLREYNNYNYSYACHWIDYIRVDSFTGWGQI
jgi:hypothetical protein